MPRVVHFDISAREPGRAAKFYGEVFGWKFDKWQGPMDYWLITTGDKSEAGIDGGMAQMEGPPQTIYTIDVPSVEEYIARVTANGGKVVMPKSSIPGVGYMAQCEDTEGNVFGIMQSDPTAA